MESATPAPAGETDAQKQARLRRERRNAKIQAGGSERLNKITSLSGRPAAAEAELARSPSPRAGSENRSKPHGGSSDDPAEVDISQMFRRDPADMQPQDQQELLRQLLAGTNPQPQPDGFPNQQMPGADDPLMQMMQQMMGGPGGPGLGGPGATNGLPPGLAGMFGGQTTTQQPVSGADYIWRIVHALFALALGLYAVIKLPFTGTETARVEFTQDSQGSRLFWIFATTELVLQSSRYFLDQGQLPPSGIISTIGMMLPEPYAGYVRTFSRYSVIWTTIVSDAMVVVFILGCMAWWQG